jgi:hypothetical protein
MERCRFANIYAGEKVFLANMIRDGSLAKRQRAPNGRTAAKKLWFRHDAINWLKLF